MTTARPDVPRVISIRQVIAASLIAVLICPTFFAAVRGDDAEYVGGTVASIKPGQKGTLDLSDTRELRFHYRQAVFAVPYTRLTSLEFGQKVGRRVGATIALGVTTLGVMAIPMLLSKKKKHFLTVGFKNAEGGNEVVVLELAKGIVRTTIPVLETRSGMTVEMEESGEIGHATAKSEVPKPPTEQSTAAATVSQAPPQAPVVRLPPSPPPTSERPEGRQLDPARTAAMKGPSENAKPRASDAALPPLRPILPPPVEQPSAGIVVRFTSNPTKADVQVDGEYWGNTPTSDLTRFSPGTHTIVVKKAGYLPWEQKIMLAPGDNRSIDAELERKKHGLAAAIEVMSGKRAADADSSQPTVDQVSGPSVHEQSAAPPGREVSPTQAAVMPEAPKGIVVRFTSTPTKAEVQVDGEYWGSTPTSDLTRLPAGTHTIVVKKLGYQPWERKITLAPGDNRSIDAELEPVGRDKPRVVGQD